MSQELQKSNDGEEKSLAKKGWSLEELRYNLFLAIRSTISDAAGRMSADEYQLRYGNRIQQIKMMIDHLIILAQEEIKNAH